MIKRWQRFLDIQSGEGAAVFILSTYFFLLTATNLVARAARNSYFLSRPDADVLLPRVMLLIPIVTTITVVIFTRLSKRIKLVPLIMGTGIVFALTLVFIQLFLNDFLEIFLYIWVEVISIVMFFQFYLLAGMIFNARQAKRLYGVIGTGGTLGAIVVGFSLSLFVEQLGVDALLFIAAALILGWVFVARFANPHITMQPEVELDADDQAEKPVSIFGGYVATITIVMALTILVATLVDYQFKIIAKEHFPNADELASFFALFFAGVGGIQLLMRLFVVGRLLSNLGILVGLILLPVAMGFSSLALLFSPMLLTAIILKGSDQGLRYTITEASSELLWVPVAPVRKLVAKPIVNGTVLSIFQGVAALIIIFGVTFLEVQQLSLIIVVCVVLWIPINFLLRRGYVNELLSSIENRELAFEDLTIDLNDQTITATLDRSLRNEDETVSAFALGLIEDFDLAPWAETLNYLLHNYSVPIQQKVLQMASNYPSIVSGEDLMRLVQTEGEVAVEAMTIVGQRKMLEATPLLEAHLKSPDPLLRAAAAKAIILMDDGPVERARGTLRRMLQQSDENITRIALKMLRGMPVELTAPVVSKALMLGLLDKEAATIHEISLELLDKEGTDSQEIESRNAIRKIAYTLRRPRTAPLAQEILNDYPADMVVEVLTEVGQTPNMPTAFLLGIVDALKDYPGDATIDFLLPLLETDQLSVFDRTVDTLLVIARQQQLPPHVLTQVNAVKFRIARIAYLSFALLSMLEPGDQVLLIREMCNADIQQALPLLVKLSTMHTPHTPIETVLEHLASADKVNWANVAEILDNIFTREERDLVIPLFEEGAVDRLAAIGRQHFDDLPKSVEAAMATYVQYPDDWHAVVGIDYLLQHGRIEYLSSVNWRHVVTSDARKEPFVQYLLKNGQMLQELPGFPQRLFQIQVNRAREELAVLSTLEKTILLKSADLFQNIAASDLYHVAQISKEVSLQQGATLFAEGDVGDAMYIVAQGSVRIHSDDVEIAVMQSGDCLGEIAVLDHQPRSADAVVLEDVTLLRISGEDFYDLIASNQEVLQGVIKLLTARLRTTNILLAHAEHKNT